MKEGKKNLLLGLFVLSALLIATLLLFFLQPSIGDEEQKVTVLFSNIEKINKGTRVTFAGRPVGKVVSIKEVEDARGKTVDSSGYPYLYEVTLGIDSKVKLYNFDQVRYSTLGLMGEKVIAIIPKAAPQGKHAEPLQEEKLYGHASDKMEEAVVQLTNIATTLNCFLENNQERLSSAIQSFGDAAAEMRALFCSVRESGTLDHFCHAMAHADCLFSKVIDSHLVENLSSIATQIHSGEGSLGQLIYNDTFYLKTDSVLSQLEIALNNINRYGVLFQFNSGWQKKERMRRCKMCQLNTPCDFHNYFEEEVERVNLSLDKLRELMQRWRCKESGAENEVFAQQYRELLNQIEQIRRDLQHN